MTDKTLPSSTSKKTSKQAIPPSAQLCEMIERNLEDRKAIDVVRIDLKGKSSIADFLIIASGNSPRQVGAMADHIRQELYAQGIKPVNIEGLTQGDWVLLDAGDIIVHLFRPEIRAFYNLEKMWSMTLPGSSSASDSH